MTRSSSLLTALLFAANLALVGWWTWFQVRHADDLERVGRHLAAGDVDAAARALGADGAESLPVLARTRRRMFFSEGLAFTAVLLAGGIAVILMARRQARLRADHDRFLAGATHELKTPLATIQLLLESLRDDRLPPNKRGSYIQSGLLESKRLEAGLDNVLTAAGLRSARRRWTPSDGDLAADVQRAVELLGARAEAAGVKLQADGLPHVTAMRDPDAMQLVLHNLLDNAVKYSPRGATVRVALAAEAGAAVLAVHDDGKGMDAETLAHAFEPFWRGRDSNTGGTGLGLHLVRELVAAQGGTVTAASRGPGQGSQITVRLPRRGGAA